MNEQQNPASLIFGSTSDDALNLSNYVDMMFRQDPVEQIDIPMLEKSDEDVKFDNKANINMDNISVIGSDNIKAMMSPSDTSHSIDIDAVIANQGAYTADATCWVVFAIPESLAGDTIKLECEANHMINKAVATDTSGIYISVFLSKYQVVTVSYELVQVENEEERSISDVAELYYIPVGTEANVGESLANTRDYKSIMANIGFPSLAEVISQTLPQSGTSIVASTNGYYSFSGSLVTGDYFSMYVENSYGSDISFDGTNRIRHCTLQVAAGAVVNLDYSLTNAYTYFNFIPAIGNTEAGE